MSENNNSGTQRTLQELSGRTTTGATTATVSEERPLQIGERRDRAVVGEERKFATIDEVNQAFLTPDQKQDAINKLEETTLEKIEVRADDFVSNYEEMFNINNDELEDVWILPAVSMNTIS